MLTLSERKDGCMAKKKAALAPREPPLQPTIYEASLGADGSVLRGAVITQTEAEARRRAGDDVVIVDSASPRTELSRAQSRGTQMATPNDARRM